MTRRLRARFWVEALLATSGAALAAVTVVWKDWIEILFSVDPDHGSGQAEWMVVMGLAAVAIGLGVAARHEWRRTFALV